MLFHLQSEEFIEKHLAMHLDDCHLSKVFLTLSCTCPFWVFVSSRLCRTVQPSDTSLHVTWPVWRCAVWSESSPPLPSSSERGTKNLQSKWMFCVPLLGRNLAVAAEFDDLVEEDVLEGEQESSGQDALGDLGDNALVKASVTLLTDHAVEGLRHAVLLA